MELNEEQIKKALECCFVECNCTGCPLHHQYKTDCLKYVGIKALSLITSQEQRIGELTEEKEKLGLLIDELEKEKRELFEENKRLTEENNERLRTAIPLWAKQCVELEERCMQLRSDTVYKMLDRISEHATNGHPRKVRLDVIDQIAKEMLEDG